MSFLELDIGKEVNCFICKLNMSLFYFVYDVFCLLLIKFNKIVFVFDSWFDVIGNFEFVYEELLKCEENFDFKFFLKSSI